MNQIEQYPFFVIAFRSNFNKNLDKSQIISLTSTYHKYTIFPATDNGKMWMGANGYLYDNVCLSHTVWVSGNKKKQEKCHNEKSMANGTNDTRCLQKKFEGITTTKQRTQLSKGGSTPLIAYTKRRKKAASSLDIKRCLISSSLEPTNCSCHSIASTLLDISY